MRFYFPDSQDQIDPSFDFQHRGALARSGSASATTSTPTRSSIPCPYDGMLISKAIVDGVDGGAGRYSAQQRQRLYREGIREFFRLDARAGARIDTIGDCGAFQYVREEVPPYTVDEVIDFYEGIGVDAGISLDHVILGFELHPPLSDDLLPPEWPHRRQLTLDLAEQFLAATASVDARSNRSALRKAGARRATQTRSRRSRTWATSGSRSVDWSRRRRHEILAVLEAIDEVRDPDTELHLLGVTRTELHLVPTRHFEILPGCEGGMRHLPYAEGGTSGQLSPVYGSLYSCRA